MDDILVSDGQMMRAFALWEERFRKSPREFMADVDRFTNFNVADIGSFSATYFKALLVETR